MKLRGTTYTFVAAAKTIDCALFTSLEAIQLITNVTDNIIIYNFADATKGGTLSGTVLTLAYNTASMDNTDKLQILVEDGSSTVTASGTVTANAGTNLNTSALATSAKQDTLLTELQLKADLTETQPVSLASVPSHAVTNAGTFVVQENGAALTSLQLIDDSVATLGTSTYTEASTKGLVIGAVRRDADTTLVDTTNEIGPVQMNAAGQLKVEVFSGETLPVSLTSTTITGTVAATQSGTWVIGAGTSNIGDVDVLTLPALPAGTNNIGDVDILTIAAGDNNIGNVDIVTMPNVTIGTMANLTESLADDAAFTPATSRVLPIGFTFDDVAPDSVNEGDIGAARMSANRNIFTTIRDAAGNERGVNVTAGNAMVVDGSAVTQPVSLASVPSHAVTNAGTFAVQVDGAALTALQLIDDAIFADDAAFTLTSSKTIVTGAIRDDALSTLTAVEGDVVPLRVSSTGALHVTGGGGGTEYTEDVAAAADPVGTSLILVRKDTPATVTSADGDNIAQRATNYGAAYVQLVTSSGSYIDSVGGGTQYAVDAALGATPTGTLAVAIRDDALSALTPIEGDAIGLRVDANGALWTHDDALDAALAGSELQVDVVGALPAGTNNIGDVDVLSIAAGDNNIGNVDIVTMPTVTVNAHAVTNAGTFAVQVDGSALTALQLIDDTVTTLGTDTYTEATSKGLTIGAVRRDADTTLVGTTNEFGPLQMDANGRLKVEAFSGEALPVTLTSTTVTGTVAVTQSGTWDEVGINDSGNSITVDSPVGTPTFVRLSDGSAAISTLPVSLASVPSHAVTNAGTFAVQVDGSALTALQLIDDAVYTDDTSTHATGTTKGLGIMAAAAPTDTAVNANDIGMVGMTVNRALYASVQDALPAGTNAIGKLAANSGVDIGDVDITSIAAGDNNIGNVDIVSGTITTVSTVTNLAQMNGAAISMGVGATGTGVQRVVVANDTGRTLLSTGGSVSSSGNNTLVAAGTNKLKVYAFSLSTVSTTAVTCIFQSGASGTELWRVVLQTPASVAGGANLVVQPPAWLFSTASATLLNLNLSAAVAVNWSVSYFDEA